MNSSDHDYEVRDVSGGLWTNHIAIRATAALESIHRNVVVTPYQAAMSEAAWLNEQVGIDDFCAVEVA